VRWQVDLLFKLWKSHAKIDEWRSHKPWRILCEIYAKLIGLIIQHWWMITAVWTHPERSFFRAVQFIQKWALTVAFFIQDETNLRKILQAVHLGLVSHCRIRKRKRCPGTFHMLLAVSEVP
jgi:hypothetical protein